MSTQISTPKNHVIRYQNLPVLTTMQLATFFGASQKNILDNFRNNENRFVEGKHYFKLVGDKLRQFKDYPEIIGLVSKNAKHLILWTERGAARHAKMLDTDHAWEVFEQLEDSYFKKEPLNALSPEINYRFSGNGLYLPRADGKYFVESKSDGTMVVRPANQYSLIRKTDLDVVKKDIVTIQQELALFLDNLMKMEASLEVKAELLPIFGELNWRGI